VPAAVFALGLATTVHAQDTFNACFKINKSKVRPGSVLVNQTPERKSTETLRTWNEEGPPGPQGPSGTANCAVEEFPGSNAANTFSVLNVTCSGGKRATGAGAIWHTPFDAADNGPFYFFPRSGVQWTVIPYNHTASTADYRVFLQCCS
jgi:hypothetical protein